MPLHVHKPRCEDIKAGADSRIRVSIQNPDGSIPDLSLGTGTVKFVHRDGVTAPVTKSIALELNPAVQPQCSVSLLPADTASWPPGVFDAYGDVTAGGKVYKPTFWGRVLKSTG